MKTLEQRVSAIEKRLRKIEKMLASKHGKQYDSVVGDMQKKGGEARAAKLSAERRQQIASNAAKTRWANQSKENSGQGVDWSGDNVR